MTFVGLDLHKRYLTPCGLDAQGAVLSEQRRMPVSLETLLDWLAQLPQPVTVGMYFMTHGLEQLRHPLALGRRLQENISRRAIAQHRTEALRRSGNPLLGR